MLARRLPSILPPLSFGEALEATKLYSIASLLPAGQALLARCPFRSPLHSISDAGLIAGGSLAHHGVLFLDELPSLPGDTPRSVLLTDQGRLREARLGSEFVRLPGLYSVRRCLGALSVCPRPPESIRWTENIAVKSKGESADGQVPG
jgi:Magnesium chelatase, subunit ChlI